MIQKLLKPHLRHLLSAENEEAELVHEMYQIQSEFLDVIIN